MARLGALTGLAVSACGHLAAHQIPSQVSVRMLAEARGGEFLVVVRVPMGAIRDVEVPEFGPGYLDIETLEPQLEDLAKQWIAPFVEVFEDGARVAPPAVAATQVSLPSDRSLSSLDGALAHLARAKPENSENLVWDQVFLDVLLRYAIASDRSAFSLRSGLGHLGERVTTALVFKLPDGAERAYALSGSHGHVALDPSWAQAAAQFTRLGVAHILSGPDHLLFLLCLVLPLRNFKRLALIVTAFTLAHSVTLVASALGYVPGALWFPPFVETLIAVSIFYMAVENIAGFASHRWLVALAFGLVHGFGFSFALSDTLQFAGSHLVTSLLAFNVGVELGQLAVLCVMLAALAVVLRGPGGERLWVIVISAVAAHEAWHWTFERFEMLRRYQMPWAAIVAGAGAIAAGLAVWWCAWHLWRRVRARPVAS